MTAWRPIEVYSAFIKLSGEIEVVGSDRLTDSVNAFGDFIELRNAMAEPLSVNYPVLSRREPSATVSKSSVILIAPTADGESASRAMWQEKAVQATAINTQAFSMICDVHLEARHSLQDHLERHPGEFLPVTNVSALWVAAINAETHALQRPFALLNPAAILSFSAR